ncbi:MAG TPA: 2OG-Fe(II) oxygenase [Rhizomicrobium sp.]|nr:2OG-Fe(II) oxygenase [Rhizomicrobium sp.]
MTTTEENLLSTLPYTAWADAFTPGELDRIEEYGDRLTQEKATLWGVERQTADHDRIRITRTAWIAPGPETRWLYDRMQAVIRALNDKTYQFDLRGFSENFQYTVYHGAEGGHYDWHVDHGPLNVQRKLSISLQLSDGARYEGGDLQFRAGRKTDTAPRERGVIVAFPSYVLHRVLPVTAGTRKALVAWTTGPRFR